MSISRRPQQCGKLAGPSHVHTLLGYIERHCHKLVLLTPCPFGAAMDSLGRDRGVAWWAQQGTVVRFHRPSHPHSPLTPLLHCAPSSLLPARRCQALASGGRQFVRPMQRQLQGAVVTTHRSRSGGVRSLIHSLHHLYPR